MTDPDPITLSKLEHGERLELQLEMSRVELAARVEDFRAMLRRKYPDGWEGE